jgi:hypothetical protein
MTNDDLVKWVTGIALVGFGGRDWYFKTAELRRLKQADADQKKEKASGQEATVRVKELESEDQDKRRLETLAEKALESKEKTEQENKELIRQVADLGASLKIVTARLEDTEKRLTRLEELERENMRLRTVDAQNTALARELALVKEKNEENAIQLTAALRGQERSEGKAATLEKRCREFILLILNLDPNWKPPEDLAHLQPSQNIPALPAP